MTAIIQRTAGVQRGAVAVVVSLAFAAGLALPASALAFHSQRGVGGTLFNSRTASDNPTSDTATGQTSGKRQW